MAEQTHSPSLPSTADATPYIPVSWMAAAAAVVAGVFFFTLLGLGWFAFKEHKPLLVPELLTIPAIALVLCFAARRIVRNSEGTRTELLYGVNLINAAWWTALVLGLCYVAYLFAIDYAIDRDARGIVDKWMAQVTKGTDEDTYGAFWYTLNPGKRQSVSPTDRYQIERLARDEFLAFRNSDLVRLAHRNKGDFTFETGAVTWTYKPGTVDCTVTGAAKCKEGTFPLLIPLKGIEGVTGAEGAAAGRQWVIARPQGGGFVDQARATRTPYGWLLLNLEMDGGAFGKGYVSHLAAGPASHTYAYRAFVAPGGDRVGWGTVAADPFLQFAFAGPARAALGDAGHDDYMKNQFFKGPNGAEPTADQRNRFFTSWNAQGVRPAGEKLKGPDGNPIDKDDVLTLTENAVEVRVPIEIPILGRTEVARGRIVVVCTAPAVLEMLKRLRDAADPARGTTDLPPELRAEFLERFKDPANAGKWQFPWRVARIESDMVGISLAPARPGMPGGPGGPGDPGMGAGATP